jgi:hypothetical protein
LYSTEAIQPWADLSGTIVLQGANLESRHVGLLLSGLLMTCHIGGSRSAGLGWCAVLPESIVLKGVIQGCANPTVEECLDDLGREAE